MSKCNVCGETTFAASFKGRPNVLCTGCGSLERTRVLKLFLEKYDLPKPGMRVLHFAPEIGIARYIHDRVGSANYETYDISPKNYSFEFHRARRLDLCKELPLLNNRRYDLIIHNHVLEHLPCNYTMVLLQLHALLTPGGYHAFSVPIRRGLSFSEDFSDLEREERIRIYGQGGHIRNFGSEDFDRSVGMIFDLKGYNLLDYFEEDALHAANVLRRSYRPSSSCVYFLGRDAAPILRCA